MGATNDASMVDGQHGDVTSDGIWWLVGLGVALVGAMVLFWLLTDVLDIGEGVAGLPAGAVLASSGPISLSLKRRSLRGISTRDFLAIPRDVVSPSGFEVSALQALTIGIGVYIGAAFAASLFGSFVAATVLGFPVEPTLAFGLGAGVMAYLVVSFALGYWIGTRRWRRGFLLAVLTVAIARFVDILLLVYLVPGVLQGTVLELEGAPRLEDVVLNEASMILTLAVLGAATLGWYRGRSHRASAYLAFLARLLPQGSRDALADMAYQEASTRLRSAADG